MHDVQILSDIATAIVVATAAALLARLFKQPLILGYLLAGVAVGPEIGFGLVHDHQTIELISEISSMVWWSWTRPKPISGPTATPARR